MFGCLVLTNNNSAPWCHPTQLLNQLEIAIFGDNSSLGFRPPGY